jgi:hypothetical protein
MSQVEDTQLNGASYSPARWWTTVDGGLNSTAMGR